LESHTEDAQQTPDTSSVPYKWLFFAGTLVFFIGLSGTFYDITYHITHKVDTFFQPGHLLIYSNIFGSVVFGIVLYLKTRFKLLMVIGGIILGFGGLDLLWHNTFGFDSFLSPPHLLLISTAILGTWAMFRKFTEMKIKSGAIISLTGMLLGLALLLLAFSMTFVRGSSTSYYLMPPREVSALAAFVLMPAALVMVARLAHLGEIKFFHIAAIFAASMTLTTILANPSITFTMPLLLAGTLIPSYLYDKRPKYGTILLGAAWMLMFTPYSYQVIAYVVSGEILGVLQTSQFLYALGPYYPLASAIGIVAAIVTSKVLTRDFMAKRIMLWRSAVQQPTGQETSNQSQEALRPQ
jgi:hypothetical protein